MMVYLSNPWLWATLIALIGLGSAAATYMRTANALRRRIDVIDPDLWNRLLIWNWAKRRSQYYIGRGGRIERLVLWGSFFNTMPQDAEFRALLGKARWAAFVCLVCWIFALIFLSRTGLHIPRPPGYR
jgi:hypothetical protein